MMSTENRLGPKIDDEMPPPTMVSERLRIEQRAMEAEERRQEKELKKMETDPERFTEAEAKAHSNLPKLNKRLYWKKVRETTHPWTVHKPDVKMVKYKMPALPGKSYASAA